MKRFTFTALLVVTLLPMLSQSAHALPMLRLTDVGSMATITITDGDMNDLSGLAGVIVFTGALGGTNWMVNVTTGITKPVLGSVTDPHMDLNSVNVSSTGPSTLKLEFTDGGFGPAGDFTAAIGGTAANSLLYEVYADAGNASFGTTTLLASQLFGSGAFSGTATSPLNFANPFSLTQIVTITHPGPGAQSTSFNAEVTASLPSSLLLLGSGLVGFALVSIRSRRKGSA